MGMQPHPRVLLAFAFRPREEGWVPPAGVETAQTLFLSSLTLHLLGQAATRLCKREMQKFQALGPSGPGQASFFPHITKDPPSNIVGASSSAHLFGFSRSLACAGLGTIIRG